MSSQLEGTGPSQPSESGRDYEVDIVRVRFWTGTLPPGRLHDVLNRRSRDGWTFRHSITVQRRILFIFRREAYFLIFDR